MISGRVLLICLGVAACGPPGPSQSTAASPPPTTLAGPSVTQASPSSVASSVKSAGEVAKTAGADLESEEHEANPYSESVTLKLNVAPPLKAQIVWGAKILARVSPGNMEASIERPRGSGPLDLEIRADGYLPYHTRLYADRNDKVSVRLIRTDEAPGLFGYKRSVETTR